jgi:hypothetical protein
MGLGVGMTGPVSAILSCLPFQLQSQGFDLQEYSSILMKCEGKLTHIVKQIEAVTGVDVTEGGGSGGKGRGFLTGAMMGGRVLAEVGKDQIENKERNEEILQEFQQKLNSSLFTLDQLVIQNIPRVSGEEYTKLVQLLSHIQDSSSSSGGPLTTCGGYLTIKDSGLVKVVRRSGELQWVLPHEVDADADAGVNEADGVEGKSNESASGDECSDDFSWDGGEGVLNIEE